MNDDQPANRIDALRAEHRQLDAEIAARVASGDEDLMTLARLKKRKLLLKDQIARLESQLIPDLNA